MIFQKSINKFSRITFLPLILIHIIVLEHLRFTLWPEMVVYPYLVNNGFSLYKDLINPYPPTLTLVLSMLTRYFGYQPHVFQLLTWVLIFFVDLILYKVALKVTKKFNKAILSLAFFVLVSIPFGINGLWFDLVQTPFVILSVYNFIKFKEEKSVFNLNASFILVIISIFIKQQVIWLILVYILILFFNNTKNIIKIFFRLYPALIFFIAVSIEFIFFFYRTNTLLGFLYWIIYFPFIKASQQPGYLSLPTIKQLIPIIIILLLSIPSIIYSKPRKLYLIPIATALLFFAYPRFDYFHLIPALALISIFVGLSIKLAFNNNIVFKLTYSFLIVMMVVYAARFINRNNEAEIRFFEPEVQTAATFVALSTRNSDLLYIQNGPDQIFVLASRLPIKPWADEFPWYLEKENLQQEVVNSLKLQKPKFIIYQPYTHGEKYGLGSYKPQEITDYLDKNYQNYYQISKTLWLKKKV